MKAIIFFIALALISIATPSYSQGNYDTILEISEVDSLPKLTVNGLLMNVNDYIYKNMQWKAGMNEDEKIILSYIIDSKGYIRSIEIIEMPQKCDLCTKEFIKVFTSLPPFEPAIKDKKHVSVRMKEIFYFRIIRN